VVRPATPAPPPPPRRHRAAPGQRPRPTVAAVGVPDVMSVSPAQQGSPNKDTTLVIAGTVLLALAMVGAAVAGRAAQEARS
jgi:hypothetical protein